jgi:putative ABC transport system substrate-binding protein
MRRRAFVSLIGASVAWPFVIRAQQSSARLVGFLNSGSPDAFGHLVAAFHKGLGELGYMEGQSLRMEYRWAEGAYGRLPGMAADLVQRRVSVIVAGAPPAVQAAKAATKSIPIVFTSGGDPVELGFVTSLNRPGGNVTGVSFLVNELAQKRLELLRQLVPAAVSVGLLVNPSRPSFQSEIKDTEHAARTAGLRLHVVNARTKDEIDAAFRAFAEWRINALLVATDPFFLTRRDQLVAEAARLGIPTMYNLREYVAAGGLICYAPSIADAYRQAGVYTAKILKGAYPGDLPVTQPTKFELVINTRAARKLNLGISHDLLARADEVID